MTRHYISEYSTPTITTQFVAVVSNEQQPPETGERMWTKKGPFANLEEARAEVAKHALGHVKRQIVLEELVCEAQIP